MIRFFSTTQAWNTSLFDCTLVWTLLLLGIVSRRAVQMDASALTSSAKSCNNDTSYYWMITGCRPCRLICDPPYEPHGLTQPPAECSKRCFDYLQKRLPDVTVAINSTTSSVEPVQLLASYQSVSATTGSSFMTFFVVIVIILLVLIMLLILVVSWRRIFNTARKLHERFSIRSGGVAETTPPDIEECRYLRQKQNSCHAGVETRVLPQSRAALGSGAQSSDEVSAWGHCKDTDPNNWRLATSVV